MTVEPIEDIFSQTGEIEKSTPSDDVIRQAIELYPDEEGRRAFDFLTNQMFEFWDQSNITEAMLLPEAIENTSGMTAPIHPEAKKTCETIKNRLQNGVPVPVVVSNLLLSTSLFKPGSRRKNLYVRKSELIKTDAVMINYDGPEMAQGELDTLLVLNSIMANTRKPVVEVSIYQLTSILGMGHGSKAQEELENRLKNLSASQLDIQVKTNEIDDKGQQVWNRYVGNLVFSWSRVGKKKTLKILVNPVVSMLMRDTSLTLLDLKTRLALKRNNLAKWLYTYAREMTVVNENNDIVPRIRPEQWEEVCNQDENWVLEEGETFDNLVYRLTINDLANEYIVPPKQDKRKKTDSAKYYIYDLKKRLEQSIERLNSIENTGFVFDFDRELGIIKATLKNLSS